MVSQLLSNESPLQVLPSLAVKVGLNEAMVLQQVHYWLNPKFNSNFFENRHWVHNTYAQWQEQFPFRSERTLRRAIGNLEKSGLLISFITKEFKKVKYYTINYDKLNQMNVVVPLKTGEKFPKNVSDIDVTKRTDRSGQNDPIDLANVATFYNKETENTYTEITFLPPPTSSALRRRWEDSGEEEDFFKNTLETWNQKIQTKLYPDHPVQMTKKRFTRLREMLQTVFDGRENWEDYCEKIAANPFLMGNNQSGFRVTLDWALQEENARKVLEHVLYIKPSVQEANQQDPPTHETFLKAIETCLSTNVLKDTWRLVCIKLAEKFHPQFCINWFLQIVPVDLSDNVAVLGVSSPFVRDYLTTYYGCELKKSIQSICPKISTLTFQVHQSQHTKGRNHG